MGVKALQFYSRTRKREGKLCITVDSLLDFLKVVRLVFWSGVVGPGSYDRASRSKARLVSKSNSLLMDTSIRRTPL